MLGTTRKALRSLARESFKYIVDETKKYYPWLKDSKEEVQESIEQVKEEAVPAVNAASEKLSKLLLKKYEKAADTANALKNAKKKQKALKKKVVRNAVVGSAIGFTAGITAGYVLVKKSQIKESDYVFDDKQVLLTEGQEEVQPAVQAEIQPVSRIEADNTAAEAKDFESYNDDYKISTDGTTIINK